MKRTLLRLSPLFIFILLSLFLWRGLSLDPQLLPSVQTGKPMPEFHLPELYGNHQEFSNNLFHGKPVVLTVWASWCAACIEEQPFLLDLQQQGISIYGLNYKDDPTDAKRWLAQWGNPYQFIGDDRRGKVAIDLGVYGAPETFLIDAQGMIRLRHVGVLTEDVWSEKFLPIFKQSKEQAA